jgi:hypothetical protein
MNVGRMVPRLNGQNKVGGESASLGSRYYSTEGKPILLWVPPEELVFPGRQAWHLAASRRE